MAAIAQNNRYGTIAVVASRRMEFATEEEAIEYQQDKESFAEVLQKEINKCKLKYGGRKYGNSKTV